MRRERLLASIGPGSLIRVKEQQSGAWWLAQVVICEGSARNTKTPSHLFVADVDAGTTRWIHADAVSEVVWSMDGGASTSTASGNGLN